MTTQRLTVTGGMKSSISIFFVLASCLSVTAQEAERATDSSKGYSIQRIRTEPLPERVRVIPKPSGDIVAVVTRQQTMFYYLNGNTCSGPDVIDIGETTTSEAARGALKESIYIDIYPQWQKGIDGENLFILDLGAKTGLRRSNGKWVETSTTNPLNRWPGLNRKHQHRKIGAEESPCLLEPLLAAEEVAYQASPREFMQYKIDTRVTRIQDAVGKRSITINGIRSIHPEYDLAIVSTEDYQFHRGGNMVYLNLESGVAKEFISNRGLNGTRGYSSVRFSPDHRWILVTLNHGHLSHEGGGYLQLFDLDGNFVEELAIFSDDVFSPAGRAHWLPNNWIVYDDHKEIHFLKYTSE